MGSLNPSAGSSGSYGTAVAPVRQTEPQITPKHIGYGLPCVNCKTYYAADLTTCPVCHDVKRVSPSEPLASFTPAEQLPDPEKIQKERDRFLQQVDPGLVALAPLANTAASATFCNRQENHAGSPQPATVCQSCFERLQQRVDVLEAAMHMDVGEASQIVYDAVWANPSDPNKTYQNAAQALLTELRRRSGIVQIFGQLQPPAN